jgi:long-chain-fatty-acid--CoA ligase ACSBG
VSKRPIFHRGHDYKYTKYTWKQYHGLVMDAAAAYISMGLQPMDAVNIRGVNSPEWLIAFLGCIAAGGLPVGLYPTDSPDTLKFKALDSGAKFVVLGRSKDLNIYAEFLDDLPAVKGLILWDANEQHPEPLQPELLHQISTPERPLLMWKRFLERGQTRAAAHFHEIVRKRIAEQKPGQAGTVVYTSGSTGNPKGVLLSQDSVTWSAEVIAQQIIEKKAPGDGQIRIVSYLPLNHVAGQMLDILGPLYLSSKKGQYVTVYFPAQCYLKKRCFKEQLVDAQPVLFLGVPEVWDGLRLKIEDATNGWFMGKVKDLSPGTVLKGVGLGSVKYAVSGAGPITKSTLTFFHDMGLNILNMFAQSESAALGTAWRNSDFAKFNLTEKFGSIGRALGNELRITDPDDEGRGEIELKGRNVMLGYMNRMEKTKSAITEDGWLKTGDMGKVDKDGFVFLTGRLKEIMKTHGGEMIAPVAVEEGIKKACNKPEHTIVKQAIVVGDNKYYISVLLTLIESAEDGIPTGMLAGAAKYIDTQAKTIADAMESVKWSEEIRDCIASYNKQAAKSQEAVYRYAILPEDITAEHSPDLMTPTFKIKRTGVNERYEDLITTCGGEAPLEGGRVVKQCGS